MGHYLFHMFEESQQKQKLVCAGTTPSLRTCISIGCQEHSFVCDNEDCVCRQLHHNHQYILFTTVLEKVKESHQPKDGNIGSARGEENVQKRLQEHEHLVGNQNAQSFVLAKLKGQIILGEAIDAELCTGNNYGLLLKELSYQNPAPEIHQQDITPVQEIKQAQEAFEELTVDVDLQNKTLKASDIESLDRKTTNLYIGSCKSEEWSKVAENISKLPCLESLRLYKSPPGDDIVGSLRQCTQLKELFLSCCEVTEKGMQFVSQNLPTLTELDLSNDTSEIGSNGLCKKAAPAISTLKNLTKLTVYNEKVKDEGMETIAKGLVRLEQLNASNTDISDKGVVAFASNLTNLTWLNIENNKGITDTGIEAIANRLSKLVHLNFQFNDQITKNGVMALANRLGKLEYLSLNAHFDIGQDGVQAICRGLPLLVELTMTYCRVEDEGGVLLARSLTKLKRLLIYGNKLGNEATYAIANNFNLDQIWIDNNEGIFDGALLQLASKHNGLTYISAKNKKISPWCCTLMSQILPQAQSSDN